MTRADYTIKTVQSREQLEQVYAFATPILNLPSPNHSLEDYIPHLATTPQLLVFAERDNKICGCALSRIDQDHVLVGPVAVADDCRRQGIGAAMLRALETHTRELGQDTLLLGARKGEEPFYASCGYQPHLFIQLHEPGSVARLQALNQGYPIAWQSEEGAKSKLMLRTGQVDKDLQAKYDRAFPNCYTQYVFIKKVG